MFTHAFTMCIDSTFVSGIPAGIIRTSVYWFALLNWKLKMIIQILTAYYGAS